MKFIKKRQNTNSLREMPCAKFVRNEDFDRFSMLDRIRFYIKMILGLGEMIKNSISPLTSTEDKF